MLPFSCLRINLTGEPQLCCNFQGATWPKYTRQDERIPYRCDRDPSPVKSSSRNVASESQSPVIPFDRHRGSGCPLTPATPPCVRVRTRRFEMVTLARILQIRETERFEIG